MGCDGGSIPKRKEVVKNKQRRPRREETEQQAAERWNNCAACDWVLKKPIMAGNLGHLMSKECVIEHYLEWREDRLSAYHRIEDHPDALGSLHTMKDAKELKLTENPVPQEEYGDAPRGDYVCPITGLETDGKHKFVFSWRCGCVVSERAMKEVDMEGQCLVCQKPFHKADLVIINPTKKELVENSGRLVIRKMRKKGFFKDNDKQEYSSSQESANSAAKATDDGWGTTEVADPMAPSTSTGRGGGRGRGRRTRAERESSSQESASTSTTKKHKS